MSKAHQEMAAKPKVAFDRVKFVRDGPHGYSSDGKLDTLYSLDLNDKDWQNPNAALRWIRNEVDTARQKNSGYTPLMVVLGSRAQLSECGDDFAQAAAVRVA